MTVEASAAGLDNPGLEELRGKWSSSEHRDGPMELRWVRMWLQFRLAVKWETNTAAREGGRDWLWGGWGRRLVGVVHALRAYIGEDAASTGLEAPLLEPHPLEILVINVGSAAFFEELLNILPSTGSEFATLGSCRARRARKDKAWYAHYCLGHGSSMMGPCGRAGATAAHHELAASRHRRGSFFTEVASVSMNTAWQTGPRAARFILAHHLSAWSRTTFSLGRPNLSEGAINLAQ